MPEGVPNKRDTGEFKQIVVETMMREKLSNKEAARQFEVSYNTVVAGGHEFIWQVGQRAYTLNAVVVAAKVGRPNSLKR